ncbi:nuclear body protein SP140-like protein [Rana temporaria]|uniref:nuclear body protein SP140-like protein n=1 Tax=Rana temporaria TaxID=8407 RepID=UPI001AADC764|nr:nuclear body protein SP140-like protein [Rana temporaria]
MNWFYGKSKVPICLAITECDPFLGRFTKLDILSEEESLELQADTRYVHRVIYEALCWIEEKNLSLENFFDNLFQKPFLVLYPNLKPIAEEYRQGKYKNGMQTTTEKDYDQMIFAEEKVRICLAVTDLFPFIHGLQDLTILSETESLKLQADGRPISRVIYECLSLIEKKDLKLGVVFEYIFQECYQTLYPDLQAILQESNVEQDELFNGKHHLEFNQPGGLLEFYEHNKFDICAAIDECFPFLNGLHDMGLLSKLELLKLQADKRMARHVLYDALTLIQERRRIEVFFDYVFREFNINRFPALKILFNLEDITMQQTRQCRLKHIYYGELSDQDWEFVDDIKTHAGVRSSLQQKVKKEQHQETKLHIPKDGNWNITKIRGVRSPLQQKCEKGQHQETKFLIPKDGNWSITRKRIRGVRSSLQQKREKGQHQETKLNSFKDGNWSITSKQIKDAKNVKVKLEFPKQVFNDEFPVTCGNKKGTFMREHWKGDPRNDMCIECDGRRFTVTMFQKYGGKESSKNWKKSIYSSGISMEKLLQFSILRLPCNIKRRPL